VLEKLIKSLLIAGHTGTVFYIYVQAMSHGVSHPAHWGVLVDGCVRHPLGFGGMVIHDSCVILIQGYESYILVGWWLSVNFTIFVFYGFCIFLFLFCCQYIIVSLLLASVWLPKIIRNILMKTGFKIKTLFETKFQIRLPK
jgi:hypothetical protein